MLVKERVNCETGLQTWGKEKHMSSTLSPSPFLHQIFYQIINVLVSLRDCQDYAKITCNIILSIITLKKNNKNIPQSTTIHKVLWFSIIMHHLLFAWSFIFKLIFFLNKVMSFSAFKIVLQLYSDGVGKNYSNKYFYKFMLNIWN